MTIRSMTRLIVLLLFCLAPVTEAAAQPSKLEFLELGALSLRDLRPGTLTILKQQRIINKSVHRRFRITASSGRFSYAPEGLDVLSGRIHQLHIEGYIYFSSTDDIGSMIVEKRDDLRFILEPETYSLPKYGGGTVTLNQKQVWVGNSTPIDLLNRKGQIYFRTAAVGWNGIQATLDRPKAAFTIDAVADDPQTGVKFLFDLATARLTLQEGRFSSRRVTPMVPAPEAGARTRYELADIAGSVRLAVRNNTISVSSPKLALHVRSSALTPDDMPFVAAGTATLVEFTSEASFDDQRVLLRNGRAASGSFAPDEQVTSASAAWAAPQIAGLLTGLGLSDPAVIRRQAIAEAQQALGTLGTDLVFASVRRTLLEALVKQRLAAIKAITVKSLGFGPQSLSVAATATVQLPLVAKPLQVPLDAEVTLSVKGSNLVLRPVGRMLLLGRFIVPSALTLESALEALRQKLVASITNNELGLVEFTFPIDLMPQIDVDPAQLSRGELTVKGNKFQLPLELRPVIVINPETLWILSEVSIR